MDSIRASEAPDPGSIPGEATVKQQGTRDEGQVKYKVEEVEVVEVVEEV